jgi:hypothetical protein
VALSPDLETIQSDLESLKRDLATLMNHLKSGAGTEASRLSGLMCEQGDRSLKAVQQQVREQPLLYLAGAFAVGFLGSRIFLR